MNMLIFNDSVGVGVGVAGPVVEAMSTRRPSVERKGGPVMLVPVVMCELCVVSVEVRIDSAAGSVA